MIIHEATSRQQINHQPPDLPLVGDDQSLGMKLSEFLTPFFPFIYEKINLRTFGPKSCPEGDSRFTARTLEVTREGFECDEQLIEQLIELNKTRGLYFVVNSGGNDAASITRGNAWFAEIDDRPVAEQHKLFDALPLRPSIRLETKKSVHAYWLPDKSQNVADWSDMQLRMIARLKSDPSIKDASRVMRLPFLNHVEYTDGTLFFKPIELIEFDGERRYSLDEMRDAFPSVPEPKKKVYQSDHTQVGDDGKYSTWESLSAAAKQRIIDRGIRNSKGNYEMTCPAHNGKSATSLFHNPIIGAVNCRAGCTYNDVLVALGLPAFPVEQPRIHFGSKPISDDPPIEDADDADGGENGEREEFHNTDMGNGYRFARRHGRDARYNKTADKWLTWTGERWLEDNAGEVMRRAKETAISIYAEAAYATDEERRKALAKWAAQSESDSRLRAMLHLAQSELPIQIEAFDVDPYLFNCESGTIDLRTGQFRKHRRSDFLTKLSPVAYDLEAQPTRWLSFLDRIFEGDASLIRFIQKSIGYSLTGDTSEQCLFIAHGTGANGKSVFLKTIGALMADYGQQVQPQTLMVKSHQAVNNDIAILRGARFLSAIETDEGQKLAEGTIKQITGGDKVRARFLFQESFEFVPQFKIWLAANHKPEVRGTDHAIWRRIRLVPFNVTIPKAEQNPHLDAELKEELPGILAWAIEGCLLWQREGLGEPEAVTRATSEYREQMDTFGDFLTEKCVTGDNYQASRVEIYNAYETWCMKNGEKVKPAKWLASQLRDRGFEEGRTSSNRFWKKIGLIRQDDGGRGEF
jgi:putative DNA primase/helicase